MSRSQGSLPPLSPHVPSTARSLSGRPSPRVRDSAAFSKESQRKSKPRSSTDLFHEGRSSADSTTQLKDIFKDEVLSKVSANTRGSLTSRHSRETVASKGNHDKLDSTAAEQRIQRRSWLDSRTKTLLSLPLLVHSVDCNIVTTVDELVNLIRAVAKNPTSTHSLVAISSSNPVSSLHHDKIPPSEKSGKQPTSLSSVSIERFLYAPPSIVPHRLAVVETSNFLQPSDDLGSTRVNHRTKMVEKVHFPSSCPSSRTEVLHLAEALKSMIGETSLSTQAVTLIKEKGVSHMSNSEIDVFISKLQHESCVWDIVLSELVRHVHVNCGERGLLLEQVRLRVLDLLSLSLFALRELTSPETIEKVKARVPSTPRTAKSAVYFDDYADVHKSNQETIDELNNKLHKRESEIWLLKERVDYLEDRIATLIIEKDTVIPEKEPPSSPDDESEVSGEQMTPKSERAKDLRRRSSLIPAKFLKSISELHVSQTNIQVHDPAADIRVANKVLDAAVKLDASLLLFFDGDSHKKQYQSLTEMVSTVSRRRRESLVKTEHPLIPEIHEHNSGNSESSDEELLDELSDVGVKMMEVKHRIRRLLKSHEKLMKMEEGSGQDAEKCSPVFSTLSGAADTNGRTMRALKFRTTWLRGKVRRLQYDVDRLTKEQEMSNFRIKKLQTQIETFKNGSLVPKLAKELNLWKTKYETLRAHFENDAEAMASIIKMVDAASQGAYLVPEKDFWGFLDEDLDANEENTNSVAQDYGEYDNLINGVGYGLEDEYWSSPPQSPVPPMDYEAPAETSSSSLGRPTTASRKLTKNFSDFEYPIPHCIMSELRLSLKHVFSFLFKVRVKS